jgi:uncharacterized surface protein with fasciclin (FAS1) repeats
MLNRLLKSFAVTVVACAGLVAMTTSALHAAEPASSAGESIVQIAESDAALSTLVKALSDTGLVKPLEGPGPFTVFAPTNTAFANLPPSVLDYLLANPTVLKQVLLYHVVSGEYALTGAALKTLQGGSVFPSFSYGTAGLTVKVNNSLVSVKPIKASNGVIYVIDAVLLP